MIKIKYGNFEDEENTKIPCQLVATKRSNYWEILSNYKKQCRNLFLINE